MKFLSFLLLLNFLSVNCFSDYGLICNNPKLLSYYRKKYESNKEKLMDEKFSILHKNFQLPNFKFKEHDLDSKTDGGKIIERNTDDYFKDKKCVLFGLPGAFTPTCSSKHLPGYEKLYDEFKELGIDEIYCVSVNDVYVMKKWKEYENINKVKLIADGTCSFTRSIGMNVNWIKERGFGERSWRYSAYIENGVVINSFIESPFKDESVEDPFEVSDAETMLSYLKEKLKIKV
jgi:peroxiredoxin